MSFGLTFEFKNIFSLQIQFGLMALHWLALLVASDCGYPKWFAFFMLPQNFFIFFLFFDFYRKTYNKPTKVTTKSEVQNDLNNNAADMEKLSKLKETVKQ